VNFVSKTDWYSLMEKSETGKTILGIPQIMEDEYLKAKKSSGFDDLSKTADELKKKIF
jgi:hypothetical protein